MLSDSASRPAPSSAVRRKWWLVAVVAGLVLGPLDLYGQVDVPYPWANLFNSPAVWAAAAFAFGWWKRESPSAAIGAVIVMVVGVEAYYLADVLVRGADRGNLMSSTAAVWLAAGVVAGVVFGTAGGWGTATTGWRAELGRASLPAVVGAEAVHNTIRVATESADARPDDLGQFAAILAVLAVAVLVVLVRGAERRTVTRIVLMAVVAALVIGAAASAVL